MEPLEPDPHPTVSRWLPAPAPRPAPSSAPAKWRPRPLTLSCGVCGGAAADVHHYGSVACYSCRCRTVHSTKNQKCTVCTLYYEIHFNIMLLIKICMNIYSDNFEKVGNEAHQKFSLS